MRRKLQMGIWALLIILLFGYGATGGAAQRRLIVDLIRLSAGASVDSESAEGIGTLFFALMGIWPLLFLLLLWPGRRLWRPGPLPFILFSFVAGAYALLPWFILRRSKQDGSPSPSAGRRRMIRIGAAAALIAGTAAAAGAAGSFDPGLFLYGWREFPFYQVMSLDFLLFWLLFYFEARRRRLSPASLALFPVAGAALLLLIDPAPAREP